MGNQCIQFQIRQSVQNVGRNVTEPQIAVWTLVAVSSVMVRPHWCEEGDLKERVRAKVGRRKEKVLNARTSSMKFMTYHMMISGGMNRIGIISL